MHTVGIDEVGRGCWAGPLVAGAVVLDKPIKGLRDSKKLTKLQRTKLDMCIREQAIAFGIGWVSPNEIDSYGLTEAVRMAMKRALEAITIDYDAIVIDGSYNFLSEYPNVSTLVGGDDIVPAISAASIIAKVARDTYMASLAPKYPEYGFERHVGYGTAEHIAALKTHGISEIHRKLYRPIQDILNAPTAI